MANLSEEESTSADISSTSFITPPQAPATEERDGATTIALADEEEKGEEAEVESTEESQLDRDAGNRGSMERKTLIFGGVEWLLDFEKSAEPTQQNTSVDGVEMKLESEGGKIILAQRNSIGFECLQSQEEDATILRPGAVADNSNSNRENAWTMEDIMSYKMQNEHENESFERPQHSLDTFQLDVQSDNIERRRIAASHVTEVAMDLDVEDEHQVQEFFACVEQLMNDTGGNSSDAKRTPQQFIFDQLRPLFVIFHEQHKSSHSNPDLDTSASKLNSSPKSKLFPTLFEQANCRLPILLVRLLLESFSCQIIQPAAQAIWSLLSEPDLLALEACYNLIVPALFEFLRQSGEEFSSFAAQGNNPEHERWIRVRVEVLSMLSMLLCVHAKRFSRNWLVHELIPQYMIFHTDPSPMIQKRREFREVLAHSLVHVANLIGSSEFADQELFPIFQRYMRDTPEVQNALLQYLASFCKILSADCRECLVREISHQVTIDPGDSRTWRQRVQFAGQLTRLIPLFSVAQINRYLSAFALAFSADRIAEVRNSGVTMLATVMATFIKHEWEEYGANIEIPIIHSTDALTPNSTENKTTVTSSASVDSVNTPRLPLTDRLLADFRAGFWRTRNWQRRQSFGRLLYTINRIISDAQFYYLFFHDLINISEDDVANVRQYFCLLAQLIHFDKLFGQNMHKRLEQIAAEDMDLENRNLAKIALGFLNPDEEGIDLKNRKCRSY